MSTHRKIELQSPADLTYLTTNLRTAALHRLNNALPPTHTTSTSQPQSPDVYRARVESLVETFVSEILAGIKGNVSVNGIDIGAEDTQGAGEGVEGEDIQGEKEEMIEYEAFDEKLRASVARAVARRDGLIGRISAQRRSVPGLAAENVKIAILREMEGEEKLRDGLVGTVEEGELVNVGIRRAEEVERNWGRAVEGLARLKGGMGESRARLERAGGVVGYLEGKKT